MNEALIGLGLLLGLAGLGAILYFKSTGSAKSAGKQEVANEVLVAQQKADEAYQEKVAEELKDVEEIRDRLDTDPEYRDSVRAKFRRKDPS
jgi:hypothetical protein